MPKGIYIRTEGIRKKISEKTKEGMNKSEVKIKISRENSCNWKGGLKDYCHEEARKFFGKPFCEGCRISLEDYRKTHKQKRFNMHCISKDFTILEQWNWKCVCSKCHHKEHKLYN